MRVGFLGLGAIGTPMAARVARDHQLTVWNRTGDRATAFATRHDATAAATPAELARAVDVIITCLPTSREVAEVIERPDGLNQGMRSGMLLLDCTSGDPGTSRRLAAELAARGVEFADAPVSGGTNGAEAGTLTVMIGGDPAVVERARPVLQSFAARIQHVGPVGAGHAVKAVNNTLLATNIRAVGEGLAALARAGVAPRDALSVINTSSGRSFVSETLVPERVLTGAWPRTFRLALLDKDVHIALDLLAENGLDGRLLHRVGELAHEARQALGEEADYLEIIRLIETEAGVELRG
ncbi:MAG TPA: NAD(P)-dependent oxidoreductase [Gemmatimonadales bacterium]|nr:NAD(P)-dependent oxidoreductase [Gemmatimonadales bacterium]